MFSFWAFYSGDAFAVLALLLLSMSFSALLYRSFSFLHLFLLLEGMLLAIHLLFAAAAATTGTLDGEIMVLFSLAVAAAESAVGLALYRALVGGAPPRRGVNRMGLSGCLPLGSSQWSLDGLYRSNTCRPLYPLPPFSILHLPILNTPFPQKSGALISSSTLYKKDALSSKERTHHPLYPYSAGQVECTGGGDFLHPLPHPCTPIQSYAEVPLSS